mgnify:FL=1
MGWCVVNGGGMAISQDIDLGVRSEVGEGFVLVLMALDVEDFDLEWELFDDSFDGLDNVVVRCQEVEGGGVIVDGAKEILDNAFTVNWDGEGRGSISKRVMSQVATEQCRNPSEASI